MVDWVAQLVGHLFCRYNGDGAQAGTCYGPAAGTNKTVPFRQQGANKAHARNRRRQFRPRRDRLNAARGISDLAVSAARSKFACVEFLITMGPLSSLNHLEECLPA